MLPKKGSVPVSKENEEAYLALCSKFKRSKFETTWSPLFRASSSEDNETSSSLAVHVFGFRKAKNNASADDKPVLHGDITYNENQPCLDKDSAKVTAAKSCQTANLTDFVCEEKLTEIKDAVNKEGDEIDLSVLHTVPVDLIEAFFNEICISQVPLSTVRRILDQLLNRESLISHSTAVGVIRSIIYPRAVKGDAPRNLVTMIMNLCERYNAAIVEGLLVPLLQCENFGSMQLEIFMAVLNSQKLSEPDYRKIRETFPAVVPTQCMFTLLSSLIGIKNFMNDQAFNTLIHKMKEWSNMENVNLKLNNLLLKVIKVYGKKLNMEQFAVLEEIITNNTSSFKTIALRELQKLKA